MIAKLGEHIKLVGGGTPSKSNDTYWNGTIPWASVKDLKNNILDTTQDSITELGLKNSSSNLISKGTILIATRMAVGKVSIPLIDVAINQDLKGIYCKKSINNKFLFYLLISKTDYFERAASGATVKGIKLEHITELKFDLPPLPIQQKIAAILDEADKLRQLNKELIAKYDALTKSLFLEMFGDPVTNPKGWEKVELYKLCSFRKINVKPEEILYNQAYVGLECIEKESGKILEKFLVQKGELKSNKFWFNKDYILYGKLRPYLNKVAKPDFEGICSTDIIPLKPLVKKCTKEFIVSLMRGSWFVSYADERSSGANLPRISPTEIENFRAINPTFELQNQFAERVQGIETQKTQAHQALEKAENLFNSLLQKAFIGELVKE